MAHEQETNRAPHTSAMTPPTENTRALLRLTLTPGLGPRRIASLIEAFGSATAALAANPGELQRLPRIGPATAAKIAAGLRESLQRAETELKRAAAEGVSLLGIGDQGYPPLLAQIPDPPVVLYVRGEIMPESQDKYPAAIVGSRACTSYGIEQAERFGGVLARAGLTIVSGGARGIDSAAHRAALKARGRTIVVLGCGIHHCYPPENQQLFDQIAQGKGAILSELPIDTPPTPENFPARNRIISGLALGTIVIEAAQGSGALITAKSAVEDQGREVFAVPGRVDSPASQGTLRLLQSGGAAIAIGPADVLNELETPARHHFLRTHHTRYADPHTTHDQQLWDSRPTPQPSSDKNPAHDLQSRILAVLDQPQTPDQLVERLEASPGDIRTALTMLEIQGTIRRQGTRLQRALS